MSSLPAARYVTPLPLPKAFLCLEPLPESLWATTSSDSKILDTSSCATLMDTYRVHVTKIQTLSFPREQIIEFWALLQKVNQGLPSSRSGGTSVHNDDPVNAGEAQQAGFYGITFSVHQVQYSSNTSASTVYVGCLWCGPVQRVIDSHLERSAAANKNNNDEASAAMRTAEDEERVLRRYVEHAKGREAAFESCKAFGLTLFARSITCPSMNLARQIVSSQALLYLAPNYARIIHKENVANRLVYLRPLDTRDSVFDLNGQTLMEQAMELLTAAAVVGAEEEVSRYVTPGVHWMDYANQDKTLTPEFQAIMKAKRACEQDGEQTVFTWRLRNLTPSSELGGEEASSSTSPAPEGANRSSSGGGGSTESSLCQRYGFLFEVVYRGASSPGLVEDEHSVLDFLSDIWSTATSHYAGEPVTRVIFRGLMNAAARLRCGELMEAMWREFALTLCPPFLNALHEYMSFFFDAFFGKMQKSNTQIGGGDGGGGDDDDDEPEHGGGGAKSAVSTSVTCLSNGAGWAGELSLETRMCGCYDGSGESEEGVTVIQEPKGSGNHEGGLNLDGGRVRLYQRVDAKKGKACNSALTSFGVECFSFLIIELGRRERFLRSVTRGMDTDKEREWKQFEGQRRLLTISGVPLELLRASNNASTDAAPSPQRSDTEDGDDIAEGRSFTVGVPWYWCLATSETQIPTAKDVSKDVTREKKEEEGSKAAPFSAEECSNPAGDGATSSLSPSSPASPNHNNNNNNSGSGNGPITKTEEGKGTSSQILSIDGDPSGTATRPRRRYYLIPLDEEEEENTKSIEGKNAPTNSTTTTTNNKNNNKRGIPARSGAAGIARCSLTKNDDEAEKKARIRGYRGERVFPVVLRGKKHSSREEDDSDMERAKRHFESLIGRRAGHPTTTTTTNNNNNSKAENEDVEATLTVRATPVAINGDVLRYQHKEGEKGQQGGGDALLFTSAGTSRIVNTNNNNNDRSPRAEKVNGLSPASRVGLLQLELLWRPHYEMEITLYAFHLPSSVAFRPLHGGDETTPPPSIADLAERQYFLFLIRVFRSLRDPQSSSPITAIESEEEEEEALFEFVGLGSSVDMSAQCALAKAFVVLTSYRQMLTEHTVMAVCSEEEGSVHHPPWSLTRSIQDTPPPPSLPVAGDGEHTRSNTNNSNRSAEDGGDQDTNRSSSSSIIGLINELGRYEDGLADI